MREPAKLSLLGLVLAAATVLAVAGAPAAHEGASGVVKERMEQMKTIGAANKQLGRMLLGRKTFDVTKARSLAKTLSDHGGERITRLFPTGSLHKPTKARPRIWREWRRFQAYAGNLAASSMALYQALGRLGPDPSFAAAAKSRDTAGAREAYASVRATCRACHDRFRDGK